MLSSSVGAALKPRCRRPGQTDIWKPAVSFMGPRRVFILSYPILNVIDVSVCRSWVGVIGILQSIPEHREYIFH